MSMTYQQYLVRLAQNVGPVGEGVNWQVAVPQTIDYAEQRIYRELNLLTTEFRSSAAATALSRVFNLPTGDGRFVQVQAVNVILEVGSDAQHGTRSPLTSVNRQFLDFVYRTETTGTGLPQYYAMMTDQQLLLGPSPDLAYTIETVGTFRPTPLAASNPTTYLSLYLPDLFLAASMTYLLDYITMNYPNASDAAKAQVWEGQYKTLAQSANAEEMRKKFTSAFDTPSVTAVTAATS